MPTIGHAGTTTNDEVDETGSKTGFSPGYDPTKSQYVYNPASGKYEFYEENPRTAGQGGDGKGVGGVPVSWLGKLFGGGNTSSIWGSVLKSVAPSLISSIVGWFTNRNAKKLTSAEQQSQDLILQQLKTLLPFGEGMLRKGGDASNSALNFYKRTASNPRESMAPELNERARNDRATLSTVGDMAGRGGASSDFLSRLPFQRAGETTNALFGARRDANDRMATLGSNMMNTGLQAASGGRAGANSLLDFGLTNSKQAFDQGSKSARGVYDTVQGIIDSYGRSRDGKTAYGDSGFTG